MKKVSLTSLPYQSFRLQYGTELEVTITLTWNTIGSFWSLGLKRDDLENETKGLALLSGVNILRIVPEWDMYALYVSAHNRMRDPNREDISTGILYIGSLEDFDGTEFERQ